MIPRTSQELRIEESPISIGGLVKKTAIPSLVTAVADDVQATRFTSRQSS